MAKNVILNSVEANAVIDVVKNDLWRVVKSFIYPGYGVLYFLKSLFGLIEVNRELACMSVYPNSGLTFQFVKFFGEDDTPMVVSSLNFPELLSTTTTLVVPDLFFRWRINISAKLLKVTRFTLKIL